MLMRVPDALPERFTGLTGLVTDVAPEAALLFLAARPTPDEQAVARLRLLVERQFDWGAVLKLCDAHSVTGLVRRTLRQASLWEYVPPAVRTAMDRWQFFRRRRYAVIVDQLSELLAACADVGIDPIVLKGAALAVTAYPDPALRSMADLDLLVERRELSQVFVQLGRLGYEHRLVYYGDAFNLERGYHGIFADPHQQRLSVEVHWALAASLERRNRLDASALRRHTTRTDLAGRSGEAGTSARILAPHAQVVHLAAHAASEGHAFGRLAWLADLAAVAEQRNPPDWAAVVAFARQTRSKTATWVALTLARNLVGARIPSPVLEQLRGAWPPIGAVERSLNPGVVLGPVDAERRAVVKYAVVDSPATTVRLFRERLVPPPAVMRDYHPEWKERQLGAIYVRHVAEIARAGLAKTYRLAAP